MLEGLFKSKFYTKCKSNIKLIRTRIEMIKKKRDAMLKYLRNDVSDLLKNGLDIDAYNRAEGVLVLLSKSECYEFIEKFCEDILNHLMTMDKQRECPEECRETVSSLIFAAARFADLPELRELRTMFSEKYANSLDCFVNKEFAEKLKSSPPSKDKKIQLLKEIASEHGMERESKALENKLFSEETYEQESTYNEQREVDKFEDESPIKDIQVDTIRRIKKQDDKSFATDLDHEEENHKDKPFKYGIIPPPYTKSETDHHIESKDLENKKTKEANKELAKEAQRTLRFLDSGNKRDRRDHKEEEQQEEKIMDRLLRYYSRKKGTHGRVKSDSALKLPLEKNERSPTGSGKPEKEMTEDEAKSPNGSSKRHFRASSLPPEMLNGKDHVHPKLPDYDDFVAKLAELRKK